jgi:hypothetical protein
VLFDPCFPGRVFTLGHQLRQKVEVSNVHLTRTALLSTAQCDSYRCVAQAVQS